MPNTPHSSDWERFFGRNPQRRRGPIALFVTTTLVLAFLVIMAIGANWGAGQYREYVVAQQLTATPLWAQYYAEQTATAEANAAPPAPSAPARTTVTAAGNLRSEPRIAPETVTGSVAIGDTVAILENQTVEDRLWYRVRVNDDPAREGWVSSTLVAAP